jgi:hypothetical protein
LFVAPRTGGPNPLDIRVTLSWVSTLHQDIHGNTLQSYGIRITALTHNTVNADANHQHVSSVHVVPSPLVFDTSTSGHDTIDFLVPRVFYDRLPRTKTTVIKYQITVTDTIDHTFQSDQVWIPIIGPPPHHAIAGDLLDHDGVGEGMPGHAGEAAAGGGIDEIVGFGPAITHHDTTAASDLHL